MKRGEKVFIRMGPMRRADGRSEVAALKNMNKSSAKMRKRRLRSKEGVGGGIGLGTTVQVFTPISIRFDIDVWNPYK